MDFGYKKLYIDGQLVDGSNKESFEVKCPANGEVVATIACATKEDTERALVAAQKGFEYWSALPMEERLSWIEKLRLKILEKSDYLRNSVMFEMGKIWEGTQEDLDMLTGSLEFYLQEIVNIKSEFIPDRQGTHTHEIVSQPLGVAIAFLAYNFPLLNVGYKIGPALAAGCSIIIKPAAVSPLSAHLIGAICEEINFPKGVVTVLSGSLQNVGLPLCESKIPRLLTMIGSTQTAQSLIAQSSKTSIKRYSMECGGNAPFIVFDDANLDLAVKIGAALKIGNSGQICVAPNRFYIQDTIIEEFTNGLLEKFKNAKLGFGRENKPDMGPLVSQKALDSVDGFVQQVIAQGGKLIFGGKQVGEKGFYYEPTIIRLDNQTAPILQEEVFGPVAVIVPFSTKEEVIVLANDSDAGLASYVFSADEEKLQFFADKLEFGEVQLNGVKYDIYLPHGGVKNSGIGFDCSTFALDDYLIKKRVTKALS